MMGLGELEREGVWRARRLVEVCVFSIFVGRMLVIGLLDINSFQWYGRRSPQTPDICLWALSYIQVPQIRTAHSSTSVTLGVLRIHACCFSLSPASFHPSAS